MAIGITKTFPVDLGLISKVLSLYSDRPGLPPDIVAQEVGINRPKIDGINAFLGYLKLQNKRQLTPLGNIINLHDKYFDDFGTLCLLHFLLASNKEAEVWYFAINKFIPHNLQFSRDDFSQALYDNGIGIGNTRLKADKSIFLNSYSKSDYRCFNELGYLTQVDSSLYAASPISNVPEMILGFSLYYLRNHGVYTQTISISTLLTLNGQIGKIFLLPRELLLEKMKLLEAKSILSITQIADLDNVTYVEIDDHLKLLESYYQERE